MRTSKRKVNEPFINLNKGENTVINHGDEVSQPLIEIHSNGGDIEINCGKNTLTILDTNAGLLSLDNEMAVCTQDGRIQRTKGSWIKMLPGKNKIMVTGNIASIRMKIRSVFLINPIYIYEKVPIDLSENGVSLLDWADAPEITRSLNSEYSFYGNYSLVGKNNNQIKRILFESDGIGRIMAIF